MSRRVLVCLEDKSVAQGVASRLVKDGVESVVVDRPGRLVEEARRGASALAVQDKYPSGEAGLSLLRQVRVARSQPVPAIYLLTGELAAPDRQVLAKQYRVQQFMKLEVGATKIATALHGLTTGSSEGEDDLVLHEDEVKNDFDISIDGGAALHEETRSFPDVAVASYVPDDDGSEMEATRTQQFDPKELESLRARADRGMSDEGSDLADETRADRQRPAPATEHDDQNGVNGVHDDTRASPPRATVVPATVEGEHALLDGQSDLPARGRRDDPRARDADVQLPEGGADPPEDAVAQPNDTQIAPATSSAPAPVPTGAKARPAASDGDEGDSVQMQEMQKAQQELKKALLAERRAREAAQKRAEELEAKLSKLGEPRGALSQSGVPTEGVLEDLRYPALLARCRSEAFTGAVHIQSGGTMRSVFLKDGLPVAFASSEPGERIGKVLVTQGRLSDDQYVKAATRMVERGIKLSEALVELGFIDADALAVEQRNLTRDQIIQCFELVQGKFTVSAGQAPDSTSTTFDFGPGEIYVQGYRRYAPSTEMLAAYETLRDKYLAANARLASYRPKLGLGGEDERLLRLLGEAFTVEEAVERAGCSAEAAARLLQALLALDLVEEWVPGVEQFRTRLKAERQRHVEEIASLRADNARREERMLESFEKAIARLGDGPAPKGLGDRAATQAVAMPAEDRRDDKVEAKREEKRDERKPEPREDKREERKPESRDLRDRDEKKDDKRDADRDRKSSSSSSMKSEPRSSSTRDSSRDSNRDAARPMTTTASPRTSSPPSPPPPAAPPPSPPPAAASPPPSTSPSSSSSSSIVVDTGEMSLADMKFKEGVDQAAASKLDEAEVTLREAVRLDASRPEYLTALARVLLSNPRYERSGTLPVVRSLLDRAVQIAPDFTEASDLHAQVLKEMG